MSRYFVGKSAIYLHENLAVSGKIRTFGVEIVTIPRINMHTLLKILTVTLLSVCASSLVQAQDVVGVAEAVKVFSAHNADSAKAVLESRGYVYRGVTGYERKSHTWTKRVGLSADYVPTGFEHGASSIIELDEADGTLSLYVFNRAAFDALKAEARKLGYEGDAQGEFFFKEDAPSLLFLASGSPFPYLMSVSE